MSNSSSTILASTVVGVAIGMLSCHYYYYYNYNDNDCHWWWDRHCKEDEVTTNDDDDDDDDDDSNSTNKNVILSCIQRRRSIFPKQYTGCSISKDIINDMLEAARWTPSHGITEPWKFIIFESLEKRQQLGQFLADQYQQETSSKNKFSQAKYDKKILNCQKSYCIIAILVRTSSSSSSSGHQKTKTKTNPLMEEISSVAMAVQNMHLMATAHNIGAYWSTGGIYKNGTKMNPTLTNPSNLLEFLNITNDDNDDQYLCMGWFFVGDYYGLTNNNNNNTTKSMKKWPRSRRSEICNGQNVIWK
jgi:nitroreductase